MKTIDEVLATQNAHWKEDEHGLYLHWGSVIEIRIEPLLWGAAYLAVYIEGELIGEKLPITLGTPAQNGYR